MKYLPFRVFFSSTKGKTNHYWEIRNKALSFHGVRRFIYHKKWNKFCEKCNAFIPLSACFTTKPTFPHGLFGVFISGGAKIGADCTIFHQVTIGSNTLSNTKKPGAPTIGNNVYIGAGAKIIGGVKIGNNVRIGANCVVTNDIPDNSTVVLPAPRIITHEGVLDNTFVVFSTNSNQSNLQ